MQIVLIKPNFNFNIPHELLRQGVEEALDEAAKEVKQDFLRPTSQWEHKPEFIIEAAPFKRRIYTTDINYIRINNGTNRTGMTIAHGNGHLHLPSKFSPKTRPGDLYGYGGVRDYERGKNVFRQVRKSSIRPRKWDEWIARLWSEHTNLADFVQRRINAIYSK